MSTEKGDRVSKEELIQKLQEISKLCDNVLKIKEEIDSFAPQDNYSRKFAVPVFPGEYEEEDERDELENAVDHTDDDAADQMSKAYDALYHPKKPAEPAKPAYKGADTGISKEKQFKLRLVSRVGLGVGIFFLLGALIGTSDTPEALPALLIIAILGVAVFVGGTYLGKKEKEVEEKLEAEAKAVYDRRIATLNEQYNNTMKEYENECNAYVPVRQAFMKSYADWREIYLASLAEEEKIADLLEADRQAAVDKIRDEQLVPAVSELEKTNDILSKDYLGAIDLIIDLLKSGRADDLKEAINLYEDIVYRERQLQLEREKEAQRRREEELRRQDEERRYQKDREFREQQEQQRRYEEERRERDAERRHQEDMKQREQMERDRQRDERRRLDDERRKSERAELNRKMEEDRALRQQCNTCALCGNCSMAFRRPNCASYRPR